MKKKIITQKDILYLSASMFAIVVVWIAFSIYHSYVTTTISEDLQMKITPIDPKFDTATINALKSREKILPIFEANAPSQEESEASIPAELEIEPELSPTEEPINLPTIEPSPSEEPTITP